MLASWQLAVLTVVWVGGAQQRDISTFIHPWPPLAGWGRRGCRPAGREQGLVHTAHGAPPLLHRASSPKSKKQQSSRRLPAPGGHSRRSRLRRAGYTYMYPVSAVIQSPPPPWLARGQWIRHCLSEKCTNTSDLRPECEKRSQGRKTACRRAPTAVHPPIGLSNGPGHRQHAWYARTARLKSVITSNLDRSTQK